MSTLSDSHLREMLDRGIPLIDPFEPSAVQPSSIDVRLADTILFYPICQVLDPERPLTKEDMFECILPAGGFLFPPGSFCLAATLETVYVPTDVRLYPGNRESAVDLQAQLWGRSSRARMGLQIHATAGYLDPGFRGQITLEMSNLSQNSIRLRPGMGIGQVEWSILKGRVTRPYGSPGLGSHYQDQVGVVPFRA